MSATD
jgi:hypothetical protein